MLDGKLVRGNRRVRRCTWKCHDLVLANGILVLGNTILCMF